MKKAQISVVFLVGVEPATPDCLVRRSRGSSPTKKEQKFVPFSFSFSVGLERATPDDI